MAELVTAVPEEFGIVVDPTSAEDANFLHADVLAGIRAQMRGEIPATTPTPRPRTPPRLGHHRPGGPPGTGLADLLVAICG